MEKYTVDEWREAQVAARAENQCLQLEFQFGKTIYAVRHDEGGLSPMAIVRQWQALGWHVRLTPLSPHRAVVYGGVWLLVVSTTARGFVWASRPVTTPADILDALESWAAGLEIYT